IDLIEQCRHGALRLVCERFMGGPPEPGRTAEYEKASPSRQIGPQTPPVLLIYGVQDNQVPVDSADRFVLALARAGLTEVSYVRLGRAGHCPYSLGRVPALRAVVDDFFIQTLSEGGHTPRNR